VYLDGVLRAHIDGHAVVALRADDLEHAVVYSRAADDRGAGAAGCSSVVVRQGDADVIQPARTGAWFSDVSPGPSAEY